MQKLQNDTLQKFLDTFVNELKRENSDREYHDTMVNVLNLQQIVLKKKNKKQFYYLN